MRRLSSRQFGFRASGDDACHSLPSDRAGCAASPSDPAVKSHTKNVVCHASLPTKCFAHCLKGPGSAVVRQRHESQRATTINPLWIVLTKDQRLGGAARLSAATFRFRERLIRSPVHAGSDRPGRMHQSQRGSRQHRLVANHRSYGVAVCFNRIIRNPSLRLAKPTPREAF